MSSNSNKKDLALVLILVLVFAVNFFTNSSLSKYAQDKVSAAYYAVFKENSKNTSNSADKFLLELKNKMLTHKLKEYESLLQIKPENQEFAVARRIPTPAKDLYKKIFLKAISGNPLPGDLVIDKDGFVVGKVERVENGIIVASLYSAPGRKTQATVAGKAALVVGKGRSTYLIELPSGFDNFEGELVYLPDSFGYPLAVVVSKLEDDSVSAFTRYLAKPDASLSVQNAFVIVRLKQNE